MEAEWRGLAECGCGNVETDGIGGGVAVYGCRRWNAQLIEADRRNRNVEVEVEGGKCR